MKAIFVRFLAILALLVVASTQMMIAQGPIPQPTCVPGDVGCPK